MHATLPHNTPAQVRVAACGLKDHLRPDCAVHTVSVLTCRVNTVSQLRAMLLWWCLLRHLQVSTRTQMVMESLFTKVAAAQPVPFDKPSDMASPQTCVGDLSHLAMLPCAR